MTDLEILRADLSAARVPRSMRAVGVLMVAAAAAVTAAALAATHFLGEPAPAHIKATFARLGGWQRSPGFKVDASTARVMAFSPHTVLYGADASAGGTCVELVATGGFEYQFLCDRQQQDRGILLFSGIPVHGASSKLPPVVVSGHVAADVASMEARTTSGSTQLVPLGLKGFFTLEPRQQAAARRGELTLFARDSAGTVVGRAHVAAPIYVDTTGVPPRTVRGVVEDPRARHAFFEIWALMKLGPATNCPRGCGVGYAQTGTSGSATIAKNGRFTFRMPHMPAARRWYLTVEIVDARFIPLDGVDATPVPDASFWARAKAEAARS